MASRKKAGWPVPVCPGCVAEKLHEGIPLTKGQGQGQKPSLVLRGGGGGRKILYFYMESCFSLLFCGAPFSRISLIFMENAPFSIFLRKSQHRDFGTSLVIQNH